ncbi:hypothetical protein QR680_003517 [Steinernema hermaphroditum]|uniref:G-protein coupled receptors family 1 profile domain-containing protein n=1 Tax=Steinernema hermaphroditum TaxID=289476 RepID=A0AA39LS82_9BILA|nr:hypothetical protein QR680_003517 [Steinernema hermaphroditum]
MNATSTSSALEDSSGEGQVSELCMDIVKVSLLFFGIFGIFGNFNIILATYTHKSLRSKCGLLLAILAFCDFWCLAFELLSAVRILTNTAEMPRKHCFWSISFYLFIENVESYMIFAVGFDRLLAICLPIKYMLFRARYYVPLIIVPGVVYSVTLMVLGIVYLDDATIPVCNPPLAYANFTADVWNYTTMIICLTTIIVYVSTYTMLYKIAPKHASLNALAQIKVQKIMVKTLTVC